MAGMAAPVLGQAAAAGAGGATAQFILTALGKGSQTPPLLEQNNVTITVRNRPAEVTGWTPLRGDNASRLQLVFLFDESAPHYLALQFPSLRKFIQSLPPGAQVGVAYMSNGRAQMAGPLTSDHVQAANSLRMTNAIPGVSASPYFCLSDLAKHWPSKEPTRRVVFMVSNGEDPYYMSRDMQDPYLAAAIGDAQRAGLLVYSIYFRDVGFRRAGGMGTLIGQSYLLKVAQETGGQTYLGAMTTPVSFDPFLDQFRQSLDNQYAVSVAVDGSGMQSLKVKLKLRDVKLAAPSKVVVGGPQGQ